MTMTSKLSFGISALDEALCGGIPESSLTVVVAPPKYPTTAFLIDACCRWAAAGQKVLLVTDGTEKEAWARLQAHSQPPTEKAVSQVKVVSLADAGAPLEGALGVLTSIIAMAPAVGAPPAVVLIDTGRVGLTKKTVQMLKDLAHERRVRVLASCPAERSAYHDKTGVFNRFDARPEEFTVAKNGYAEYAASVILALQYAGAGARADVRDERGFECKAMKLHLASAREGAGPLTIPMLAYPGSCRFIEDRREVSP